MPRVSAAQGHELVELLAELPQLESRAGDQAVARVWQILEPSATADARRIAGHFGEDAAAEGLLWLVEYLGKVRTGQSAAPARDAVGYLLGAIRKQGLIRAEEHGMFHGGITEIAGEVRRARAARKVVSETLRRGDELDAEAITERYNREKRASVKDPEKSGSLLSIDEVRDAIRWVEL
ncbi:hypothetical protein [Gryllotalpicola protaetiae]|uniref:Uncharacterized protein n=1 Tax=Gryllotalpicola protaetiae TaxID=2419771 RepID=A0A387BHZ0_9MICO|nr:hypothetical protein [Gryllotalpicola protaetiae]AYG03443.1 hypothetical protein D7I44_07760 [Gryllotalpicola protaetiae]